MKQYSTADLLKVLAKFIRPYKRNFLGASFLRLVSDLIYLYPAYAFASLITFFTNYSVGQSLSLFWMISALWALAILGRFTALYFARNLGFQVGERIALDAQLETMKHLFSLDISWHEKENAGSKLKRIDRGSDGLDLIIRIWIGNLIAIGVNIVGMIIIIASFDFVVAAATAGFLIVFFFISHFYIRKATQVTQTVNIQEEHLHGLLFEGINNIRTVKVMSLANPLIEMFSKSSTDLFEKIRRRIFWFQSGNSLRASLGQIFRLGMIAFIGLGVLQGNYEVGFIVLFYTYFTKLSQSIQELVDSSQDFAVAKYSVGRMTDLLETPINIDKEKGKKKFPKNWQEINVSDLSFSYGNKKVLDSVSFEIKRGEKIGIVGLSGAGKSTLFKMLLKEHEDYGGQICFDDISLRDISKEDYLKHVAVVLQDTEVFNFSLRDNVTIADHVESGNEGLLKRSVDTAHVSDFVSSLPQGVDTPIGEKGVRLSGGEKQRVGIARAIFKKPQVLLLDEATSHLDVESEDKIQDSLHQFFQTVTAVVIAHRLTTIKEMDRILIIEEGRILEEGTFEELHRKKGRFFDLWERQNL